MTSQNANAKAQASKKLGCCGEQEAKSRRGRAAVLRSRWGLRAEGDTRSLSWSFLHHLWGVGRAGPDPPLLCSFQGRKGPFYQRLLGEQKQSVSVSLRSGPSTQQPVRLWLTFLRSSHGQRARGQARLQLVWLCGPSKSLSISPSLRFSPLPVSQGHRENQMTRCTRNHFENHEAQEGVFRGTSCGLCAHTTQQTG